MSAIWHFCRRHLAASLFVGWAVPLLLACALAMPPWSVSDEPFHMLRAVQVAHGAMLGQRAFAARADGVLRLGAGGVSDRAVYEAFGPLSQVAFDVHARVTRPALASSEAVGWRRQIGFEFFPNTVRYPPFFYVPDGLAYWLGRAAGLRVDATLWLARFGNALVYAGLGGVAIGLAGRLRPLLMAVLMMPMSIVLGASASQDAILVPAASVLVGWVDRCIGQGRPARAWELCGMAALAASVGMARPPYAALALLLLSVPGRGVAKWVALYAAWAAIAVWCGLVAAFSLVAVDGFDPAAQWRYLAAHPGQWLAILGQTLGRFGLYGSEFVGRLGWNDTALPAAYLWLAAGVMVCTAAAAMVGTARGLRLAWAAVTGAFGVLLVAQYLDYTPTGADAVTGLVGRYFIPLVMAAGLALPSFRAAGLARRRLAYGALAVFGLVTPGVMMHHIVMRFYVT